MWRPGFEALERQSAVLAGYERVLWQASPDHRGTPTRPGRVVTLAARPDARCKGVAFRVAADGADVLVEALDVREQGGYVREMVALSLDDGRRVRALTYVAHPDNPNFLGDASVADMATQIAASRGISGANRDYVLQLHQQLLALAVSDPHVDALVQRLKP